MSELNALPPDAGFPDEAIDAAIDAMGPSRNCECTLDSDTCEPCVMTATAALLAAQPAWEAWLRGVIAAEVETNLAGLIRSIDALANIVERPDTEFGFTVKGMGPVLRALADPYREGGTP